LYGFLWCTRKYRKMLLPDFSYFFIWINVNYLPISIHETQFLIYEQASRLTNLRLVLQLSPFAERAHEK